jgi:hypothetical protein
VVEVASEADSAVVDEDVRRWLPIRNGRDVAEKSVLRQPLPHAGPVPRREYDDVVAVTSERSEELRCAGAGRVPVMRVLPARVAVEYAVQVDTHDRLDRVGERVTPQPPYRRRRFALRGAKPACVRGTGGKNDVGMIRLDFPGFSGEESLQPISWEEWFKAFDENRLALIMQDETADGKRSNFNKLVSRETANAR